MGAPVAGSPEQLLRQDSAHGRHEETKAQEDEDSCLGPGSLSGVMADELCPTSWLRHPYPEAPSLLRVSQARLPERQHSSSREMRCTRTLKSGVWVWAAWAARDLEGGHSMLRDGSRPWGGQERPRPGQGTSWELAFCGMPRM